MVCFIFINKNKALTLNGDEEVIINLNEEYIDEGVNQAGAQISGNVDTSIPGDYTITYTYKDKSISRMIHVVDESSVVMNLNDSSDTYVKLNETYIDSGCHVIDKTDGYNLTDQVEISGSVDTSQVGGLYDYLFHHI